MWQIVETKLRAAKAEKEASAKLLSELQERVADQRAEIAYLTAKRDVTSLKVSACLTQLSNAAPVFLASRMGAAYFFFVFFSLFSHNIILMFQFFNYEYSILLFHHYFCSCPCQ